MRARLADDVQMYLNGAHYMEKAHLAAIRATKNRRRTNNIYDPEYCAYWAGHNRGAWMALTAATQIGGGKKGSFVNLLSVVELVEEMHRRLEKKRPK